MRMDESIAVILVIGAIIFVTALTTFIYSAQPWIP